jgi:hypothetical protein
MWAPSSSLSPSSLAVEGRRSKGNGGGLALLADRIRLSGGEDGLSGEAVRDVDVGKAREPFRSEEKRPWLEEGRRSVDVRLA